LTLTPHEALEIACNEQEVDMATPALKTVLRQPVE
jgi:hypothetical protein